MKIDKLNFKVGQKYIVPDFFKRVSNNFINVKAVEFDIIEDKIIYVYYKGADSMEITVHISKGVLEILDITLA